MKTLYQKIKQNWVQMYSPVPSSQADILGLAQTSLGG